MVRRATAFLAGVLFAGVVCETPAFGEDCKFVQSRAASYLEQCGDKLRSFSLQMSDQSWQAVAGLRGKNWFVCRTHIEARPSMLEVLSGAGENPGTLCPGEPVVGFSFVAAAYWKNSSKDDAAILEALATSSIAAFEPAIPVSAIACPVWDVTVAEMPGRALCLTVGPATIVAVVSGDDKNAFVLAFSQADSNVEALKDKVSKTLLPKFAVEHATGDAGLLRWLQ